MAEKLVSFNKIDKLLKAKQGPTTIPMKYELVDETIEVFIKQYIGLNDTIRFVNGVADSVFQADAAGIVHYMPEMLEYAKALHYIEFFTNLKIPTADRAFPLIYGTSLLRDIIKSISQPQYNHLEEAVEETICYRRDVMISGEQSKLLDATQKIEQASNALEIFAKQFEGIEDGKMQLALDKFVSMDTKELAGAVIDVRDMK